MRVALLHTADVHVATFDRIFAAIDPAVQLDHHVDATLLDRARREGVGAVRSDVHDLLKKLAMADAVLCTCSTLGPLVDEAGRSCANVLRIDRPLMEQACAEGARILVALCLDSTREATLELLDCCASEADRQISPVVVVCDAAWAFFEAGDMDAYAASIAGSVVSSVSDNADIDCIVLAQASMRVVEAALEHLGIPVLSSPVIAARRCIDVARAGPTSAAGTD